MSLLFRFKLLGSEAMLGRLTYIASCEGVSLAPGALEALETCAGGDMRKAVTLLQSASALYGTAGGGVTAVHVADVAGVIPPGAVGALLAACRSGAFPAVQAAVDSLVKEGFPALQVLGQLLDGVVEDDAVPDAAKAAVAARCALADRRLAEGADEALQLLDVAAAAARAMQGKAPGGAALDFV